MNARTNLALLLLLCSCALNGCVESRFSLAAGSRMPSWFASAEAGVGVTLTYLTPSSSSDDVVLEVKGGSKSRLVRGQACWHPIMRTRKGRDGGIDYSSYPMYRYILAEGKIEVVEHRQMEPLFWVSDDPLLLKQAREAGSCDKG